jgi:hypothetical protein
MSQESDSSRGMNPKDSLGIFEFVMQHQGVFLPIPTLIPTGLLQVQLPLEEHEKALAVASLAEALERT